MSVPLSRSQDLGLTLFNEATSKARLEAEVRHGKARLEDYRAWKRPSLTVRSAS